jgi:hypothetical protein
MFHNFARTSSKPADNPRPLAQALDEEVNYVDFEVEHRGVDTVRETRVRRGGQIVKESELTAIRRPKLHRSAV